MYKITINIFTVSTPAKSDIDFLRVSLKQEMEILQKDIIIKLGGLMMLVLFLLVLIEF